MTPVPESCFLLVFLSPSLFGQMPDAVTLTPGSCLPLFLLCLSCVSFSSPCVYQSLRSDARCCDAGSGVVSPACLCVSQSLRCCDAGSGAASPACSFCGRPPAPGSVSRLPPCVSLCLPVSAVRCCDNGFGVVSPTCFSVSPSLISMCLPVSPVVGCAAGSGVMSPACLPVSGGQVL